MNLENDENDFTLHTEVEFKIILHTKSKVEDLKFLTEENLRTYLDLNQERNSFRNTPLGYVLVDDLGHTDHSMNIPRALKNGVTYIESIPNLTGFPARILRNRVMETIRTTPGNSKSGFLSLKNAYVTYGEEGVIPITGSQGLDFDEVNKFKGEIDNISYNNLVKKVSDLVKF